jgi:AcrR family transcriptional regulator
MTGDDGADEAARAPGERPGREEVPRDGERRPLTRESVLRAALELVDAEGLSALTMRRLGSRLGRDPMSVYRHTANRGDVLDGVAELVLSTLVIPNGDGGWQAQLRRTAMDFRGLALAHPNVVPLLATRPLSTPLGLRPLGTLRPLERLLAVLIDAGFRPDTALHAYRAYFGLLYGHVLNELQELVVDAEESDDLLRLGLHRLPAREFPYLRSLASELGRYDGAAELQLGLDYLLAGLAGQLSRDSRPGDVVGAD